MSYIELTEEEIIDAVEKLYLSFETGYEFEDFLKVFLEKIGLSEVAVTQRSRDGGIDLTCVKNGITNFSSIDETYYLIQAKRYNLKHSIQPSTVRELAAKVSLKKNCRGIIITTGKFSKLAEKEASDDFNIILIDGNELVRQCIEIGLGFELKPVFSKLSLDRLKIKKEVDVTLNNSQLMQQEIRNNGAIEKEISKNDIRAKILSIPTEIFEKIHSEKSFTVNINGDEKKLNINTVRRYFGGVTEQYRKFGLLQQDDNGIAIYTPKIAIWEYKNNKIIVKTKGEK